MENDIRENAMDVDTHSIILQPNTSLRYDWYLVQCKPKQDGRAQENLERQGYVCSRPLLRRERVSRGRRQFITESLFPGYLFVHLPEGANWAPLRSTKGVSRMVAFGGSPLGVASGLVHALQERGNLGVVPTYHAGDKVVILDGDFSGFESIFMAMDGEERAILLINMLSRQRQIVVPLSCLGEVGSEA